MKMTINLPDLRRPTKKDWRNFLVGAVVFLGGYAGAIHFYWTTKCNVERPFIYPVDKSKALKEFANRRRVAEFESNGVS